ncbi:hypothetical protein [Candidatus Pelagibacter sp. HIMB1483]|uniref:hypothetical protein n=1 Tax=Candidatus Pelagibacter sp. HIMB1483 TaxID=3415414 RepID=UPI003F86EF82
MSLQQIDLSKTLSDEQVYNCLMENYAGLGKDWISHQWNWINSVYWAFNDHYKYMIVISLVEKTMQFYNQMNIQYSYDEYYSKSYLQIEKFSITELCEKLKLPKETVRRKVLELEKDGVISRSKKKIIIDRKAFGFIKPQNQIKFTSKYIHLVSQELNKNKIYSKKLDPKQIENVIKKNFTLCWDWFYRMQIPLIIGYNYIFDDLTTFHIWGTLTMNQAFNFKKNFDSENIHTLQPSYMTFNEITLGKIGSSTGISAMSISDMTNIPRATVIRKCKYLIKHDLIKTNEKKQYVLTKLNHEKIVPYQKESFKQKAKFIRKVLNLLVFS